MGWTVDWTALVVIVGGVGCGGGCGGGGIPGVTGVVRVGVGGNEVVGVVRIVLILDIFCGVGAGLLGGESCGASGSGVE